MGSELKEFIEIKIKAKIDIFFGLFIIINLIFVILNINLCVKINVINQ